MNKFHILIFIAALLQGCAAPTADTSSPAALGSSASSEVDSALPRVAVAAPQAGSIAETIEITGTVEPNRSVALHAMEAGAVQQVLVDIGDAVLLGDVLVQLVNPALEQSHIEALAEASAAESKWSRLSAAFESSRSLISRDDLDHASAEHTASKARAEALAARVAMLQLKAPFSGHITGRYVDEGALVGSGLEGGEPVLEVQEDHAVRVVVPVPEVNAVGISRGTPVEITFPGKGGAAISATVTRTSGALAPASRTMRVEIDLNNSAGEFTPGLYARVAFTAERPDPVWLLPVASRVMHEDRPTVLVVTDGVVTRRPINEGRSSASHFEVLGPDWYASDRVIVSGKNLVSPGDRVEAVLQSAAL